MSILFDVLLYIVMVLIALAFVATVAIGLYTVATWDNPDTDADV